jgi:hypothetical protein
MAVVPFDTLKLARRLESAGFPPQQAGDTAEALAEAFGELATKGDIAALSAALDAKLELLRRDTTIRLGGMIAIGVGVMIAAMRIFTLHP